MLRESIRDCMRKMPDMDRMAKKFYNLRASLQDCVTLYDFVLTLPNLLECINSGESEMLDTRFGSILKTQ